MEQQNYEQLSKISMWYTVMMSVLTAKDPDTSVSNRMQISKTHKKQKSLSRTQSTRYCTEELLETAVDDLMRSDRRPALGDAGTVMRLAPGVNEGLPAILACPSVTF